MPSLVRFNNSASPGSCSSDESQKSVSSAKKTWSSLLARYRTSSASSKVSTPRTLASIVGTTTIVASAGGMPLEKSKRGNGDGATKIVTNQLISDTASWLVQSNASSATKTSIAFEI